MRHGPRLSDVVTATLRPLAAFSLLAWSPAFAQTICHDPPDRLLSAVPQASHRPRGCAER